MHFSTPLIIFSLLSSTLALTPRSTLNGPCKGADGAPGVCIKQSQCTSGGGKTIVGACPGLPDDVKCCTKAKCGSASKGKCIWQSNCDTKTNTIVSNQCPGPDNFKCCQPKTSGGGGGGGSGDDGKNFLDLNKKQSDRARQIVKAVKAYTKIDADKKKKACYVAVTTAMTESDLRIMANKKVPSSYNYEHDGVGNDYDSVGLFQQRPSWGTVKERMDPATSTKFFLNKLKTISNWWNLSISVAAQKVQVSAYPDAYKKDEKYGTTICNKIW